MSDYDDGASGQVENNPYCMDKNFNAKNVKSMNQDMGYHNMSDLANCKSAPVSMVGATSNKQEGSKMPGNNRYDYNKNR